MGELIGSYKELKVFQNAMEAAMKIFELTKTFPTLLSKDCWSSEDRDGRPDTNSMLKGNKSIDNLSTKICNLSILTCTLRNGIYRKIYRLFVEIYRW